ncbi:signal peptidase I [archaeon]|nr:signal peptidase I [archaeon]
MRRRTGKLRWDPELGETLREYAKYFLFFIFLAIVAFGGIFVLKSTLRTEYPVMVVVSQSMIPTLGVGDFILVGQIQDFDEVEAGPPPEGDILVFSRSYSSDEYIVHRAVRKVELNGEWFFATKGDHNTVEDSQPVSEDNVIGKVVGRFPIMGYFPLFIKTTRGFGLVAVLMILIFFADYIMPIKRAEKIGGAFRWWTLIPFLSSPLIIVVLLNWPDRHLELELLALAVWYLGCVVTPLAFEDDDMGLMFWLYHFVLTMIPLGCDLVWKMTGLTPSLWWNTRGSIVPITWLLLQESQQYYQAFNLFALLTLPGCVLFLLLMAAKRRGFQPLISLSRWIRGYVAVLPDTEDSDIVYSDVE